MNPQNQYNSKLQTLSEVLSISIIIISILFLIGWAFDIDILKSPGQQFSTIKSNVALGFVFTGISLWLLQTKRLNRRNLLLARIFAVIVALIGFLTITEYLFNINLGIDQILFKEAPGALGTSSQNRMAFSAAFNSLLTGIALFIFDKEVGNGHRPAQYLMIIVGFVSLLALTGYLYLAPELYRIVYHTGIALYATLIFILILFSALLARPDKGFMELLTSNRVSGVFGRRIILAIIIIPLILGWLRLLGEQFGLYDSNFRAAISTVSTIAILAILVWFSITSMDKIDIKRINAEEDLKKNVDELKRSNDELRQFTYITSHDLQEPLRSIVSFSQLLEMRYKDKLDDDADEYLNFIVDGAKRMKEMIKGLLDYSLIRNKDRKFELINAETSLNHAINALNDVIRDNKAIITYDTLPDVFADKKQLEQLFQYLIDNAIKFRKPEKQPKIHISVYENKEKNEYVFGVSDNGIGMEDQYTDKIFEVFKRLHTIDKYKGTGIGLPISKRIIELHGGQIWVESKLDEGATFYFTIPY